MTKLTDNELSAKVAELRGEEGINCPGDTTGCIPPYECHGCIGGLPIPYSTDMNEAWTLAEEIRERHEIEVHIWPDYIAININSLDDDGDYSETLYSVNALTLSRSICKAYIKFKESQND